MDNKEKKKLILTSLAKITRKLRGNKSIFMFSSENDLCKSTISLIERVKKDPQLTTLYKLAEACELRVWQFLKLIDEDLPQDFFMIEK